MEIEILLKNTSRSLYLSVQALPRRMRGAFGIAYLLCRYADSIADTYLIPQDRRLHWIEQFPGIILRQDKTLGAELAKEVSGRSENKYEEELIKTLNPCLDAFNRVPDEQKEFIHEVVQSVCDGMRMDLTCFPGEDAQHIHAFAHDDALEKYCRLMGGAPGLFWSKLIYNTTAVRLPENEFYRLGEHVGDALQIVNILRDLPKDLRIGRCYLPQTDLNRENLTPSDLLDPAHSARLEPVKTKWIKWGLSRLASAKAYYKTLPKTQCGQRAAVAWPVLWTADTLYKVYREPDLLDVHKRVKISRAVIYSTMLLTPLLLASNTLFNKWLEHKIRHFKF